MISDAKRFADMNEMEQQGFELEEKLQDLSQKRKVEDLAKLIREILAFQEKLEGELETCTEIDESDKLTTNLSNLSRALEDKMTEFYKHDMSMLLNLCYELLKLEAEEEQPFLFNLLNGQVKPHALVQIICSNYYDKVRSRVLPI